MLEELDHLEIISPEPVILSLYGWGYLYSNHTADAILYFEDALYHPVTRGNDTLMAEVCFGLGHALLTSAILFSNSIRYSTPSLDTINLADSLKKQYRQYFTARKYLIRAGECRMNYLRNYPGDVRQTEKLAETYLEHVKVLIGIKDFVSTLEYFFKAYDIYEKLNNHDMMAQVYNRIAWFYLWELQDYDKTIEYGSKSIEIREKHSLSQELTGQGNVMDERLRHILDMYAVVGFGSYKKGDFRTALANYSKSLEFLLHTVNTNDIADQYNYIGRTYYELGAYDSAAWFFNKALSIAKDEGFRSTEGQSEYNIGLLFSRLGDFGLSEHHLANSLKIRNDLGRNEDAGHSMLRLAEVFVKMNKYRNAEQYLTDVLVLGSKIGNEDLVLSALEQLMHVNEFSSDFRAAYVFANQFKKISDSIFESKKSRDIMEMQARFEVASKEKEIVKQREEQIAKTRQTALLHGVLTLTVVMLISGSMLVVIHRRRERSKRQWIIAEQKALRSQMNPHFIYNSLASIQNFVLKGDGERANEYLTEFSSLLRMVLENSRKNYVLLKDELEALRTYLDLEQMRFGNRFSSNLQIDPAIDSGLFMIPPLLIQPLIENAILHGLTPLQNREGVLVVRISIKDRQTLSCTIEDNGIGREQAALISSRVGHRSLGLTNVNDRLGMLGEQIKKTLLFSIADLKDEMGNSKGTRIDLDIPYMIDRNDV
ncbi:MAG: histidine kinase [Bacteroidales bacterium]|nr:histidine kinase [Bacteroidales bacterium]